MSEFLLTLNQSPSNPTIPFAVILLRLSVAALMGGAVAFLYWLTHRRDETLVWSFLSTLVLLSILIAMVAQVIGDNVARAFSLVGALSIVRFRTVVEDTRDTAFVIFSVIVGMAVGAGHTEVGLLGFVVMSPAAILMQSRRPFSVQNGSRYWNISVRVNGDAVPETVLEPIFRAYFVEMRLLNAATCRQGTALELTYRVRLRPNAKPTAIITELTRLADVSNVEIKAL